MYFEKERITKIIEALSKFMYSESIKVDSCKYKCQSFQPSEILKQDTTDWEVLRHGERWGGKDKHYLFNFKISIPEKFIGKTVVCTVQTDAQSEWAASLNPQMLAYVNGKPVQGLDTNHVTLLLSEKAAENEEYDISLYAYFGMKDETAILKVNFSILDRQLEKLYYHIKVPLDAAVLLDSEDKRRIDILKYLSKAVNFLDFRTPYSQDFFEGTQAAILFLESEFYLKFCGNKDVTALCVGHTHIDVAWLWTLAQTREKVARSFSTVLNLMKQYPEYIFMSSQPQLYKYIKEDHQDIYEEIKERVKEGRWEPEGAMWVEPDCNLTSGESLVRQLLFGKRFFKKEFDVENKILWLPDVFGYSAALPQILKKSGIDYFMTTKISWNEYNKMPYETFQWKGIDGTEILTHFITTTNPAVKISPHLTVYNGNIKPIQIKGAWDRYQQKGLNDEVLVCYGYGDGGGGPTSEMLENARRLEKGIPGCPCVKLGKTIDFFERLEKVTDGNKDLPKWVGELYFELHRGTYTTMAKNKKYNRLSEFLYQDAEFYSSFSGLLDKEYDYPQAKLNEGWETILLNQFHDILPGTSIKEVYEDSTIDYERIIHEGKEIVTTALENIMINLALDNESVCVFNPLSFRRNDVVKFDIPRGWDAFEIYDDCGELLPSQISEESIGTTKEGSKNKGLFVALEVPSKGYKAFTLKKSYKTQPNFSIKDFKAGIDEIDNKFFRIQFDEAMNITSLFDKRINREIVTSGQKANVFQAFEDRPRDFDAWDISIYYTQKMWEVNELLSAKVIEDGPVKSVLRVTKKFSNSLIIQDIILYSDIPRIDFATMVDWKENQILLKVAFPVDIHADEATYDIQYGNVKRATHWNTSWNYAMFEVCAHKWADFSEDSYGVSLLNDCKYGYDIKDGVMRLSLLRSSSHPNPEADREVHRFTYSIFPHLGDWKSAGTVKMSYELNCPLVAKVEEAHPGYLPTKLSFLKVDQENIVIEVVKKAEDSNHLIVRLYECYNRRTKVNCVFFRELKSIYECDLMEKNIGEMGFNKNEFSFTVLPYEIKTFKIEIKS